MRATSLTFKQFSSIAPLGGPLDHLLPQEQEEINEDDLIFPESKKYAEKIYGTHKELIIPKIETNIDLYAKKLREYQLRERYLPATIPLIKSIRKREAGDLLENLKIDKEFAVVVNKRDQWNKDLHLVAPWSFFRYLTRTDSGFCKPIDVDLGTSDPIRIIYHKFLGNNRGNYPVVMWFNRFIVGRPNPIRLEIHPVNMSGWPDRSTGANLNLVMRDIDVWTYTEVYPPRIEVDCANLSISESFKIGDLEKMLPEGVFLHKKYLHRLHQAIVKLEETKLFKARKMNVQKKKDEFEAKKKEIELADAMKKTKTTAKKSKNKKSPFV